jgi:valyl-tRNA synthetase
VATGDIAQYACSGCFRGSNGAWGHYAKCKVEAAGVTIEFDLTGSIDVVAERARLEKDLATATKDKQTAEIKLSNEGFMAKAPDNVVVEIRERLRKDNCRH